MSRSVKPSTSNKLMTNEDVQMCSQLELQSIRTTWLRHEENHLFILLIFQMLENNLRALAIITTLKSYFRAQFVERKY